MTTNGASPTISLMVPVFNREELLGPCIESALNQTLGDLEVVIVDGASTDRTWQVCEAYAARDPRVRIFRDLENTGPVRGWWRCLEEARGRFGTFLWSDDMIMPAFLEQTLSRLADDDVAFSYTAAKIGPRPETARTSYALQGTKEIPSSEFVSGCLTTRGRFPVSPACALFRLDDLRRNFTMRLPDPPTDLTSTGAGVDLLLYLLTASQRPTVAHDAEPLAFFRAHPTSISTEGRGGLVDRHYAATKIWFARTHGLDALIPTIVAWHWLGSMRTSGRFMSPAAARSRYGEQTGGIKLLTAAAGAVSAELAARLGQRFLRPSRRTKASP